MDALLSLAGTDVTSEAVGIPLAILLLALAMVLLPAGERRRARQGAILLGLSLLCGLARFVFPVAASVRKPLLFAATFFLLASIGRSLVLLLVDVLLERRTARPAPKIFRDVSTGIAYLAVALVALHAAGVEPGSLLTTSALLTAVIGLALQDTLGNLVSGLALQMQRPFDVGDWIEV
ncbi:MAG: mechanosensitive ion channel domain-containing protein, partial [Polyangiaceae bacterium]